MELIFKEKINSTNIYGKENIENLVDKSVVYAAFQTQGRGRMNRKWLSFNSENLYASIILKPEGDYSKLPISNLTQLLSVVIVDVLNFYGIKSGEEIINSKNQQTISTKEGLRQALARMRIGEATYLDVTDANRLKTQARIELVQAIVKYNQTQLSQLLETGGMNLMEIKTKYEEAKKLFK